MAMRVRGGMFGRAGWRDRPAGLRAVIFLLAAAVGCREPEPGPLGRVAWVRGDSLMLQALPGGKAHLVATAVGMREPRWSATGQWLALRASDGLRLVRADGGGGQKLAGTEAAEFAWAPTDDRIAYVAAGNLVVARAGGIGVVLFEASATASAVGVAWSPDGNWLAFAAFDPSAHAHAGPPSSTALPGVRIVSARGGPALPVPLPVPAGSGPLVRGWTGDGGAVLVEIPSTDDRSSDLAHGSTPVYKLTVATAAAGDSAPPRRAAAPELLADSVAGYAGFVAPAPRSPAVALVEGAGLATWRNKVLILAGRGTRSRVSAPGRAAISPTWSPAGDWIAWAEMPQVDLPVGMDAWLSLQSRRIVLADVGAGNAPAAARPLGGEPGRQEAPRWLRDGKHLLYVRVDSAGVASLRLGAAGEAERTLVPVLSRPGVALVAPGQYGFLPWADILDCWPGAMVAAGVR